MSLSTLSDNSQTEIERESPRLGGLSRPVSASETLRSPQSASRPLSATETLRARNQVCEVRSLKAQLSSVRQELKEAHKKVLQALVRPRTPGCLFASPTREALLDRSGSEEALLEEEMLHSPLHAPEYMDTLQMQLDLVEQGVWVLPVKVVSTHRAIFYLVHLTTRQLMHLARHLALTNLFATSFTVCPTTNI